MGYSYRLTARVLLYASSHRKYSTYHGLCYTSRGALAGTRNSSMDPPSGEQALRNSSVVSSHDIHVYVLCSVIYYLCCIMMLLFVFEATKVLDFNVINKRTTK